MSEPKSLIQAKVQGKRIVISVPIDGLVFIVENDPGWTYKVIDKAAFAKAVVFELQNSKSHRNDEGMNAVEELFQEAYEAVAERGDDNILTFEEPEWINPTTPTTKP